MNTRNLSLIAGVVVLLVVGGILAFVLTRPAPEREKPSESTEKPVATSSHTVSDSGTYYDIKAEYPAQTPLALKANIRATASIKAWVDETILQFKADGNFANLTAEDIKMQGLDQGRKYALQIEYKSYASQTTLSYVFQVYEDTLGAHPNAYYKTYTFDVTTGDELMLGDLFTSPDFLTLLSSISRESLRTQIAKAGEMKPEDVDTDMLNAGTEPNSNNFSWFYLEGNTLVLIFPPYSVGPWAIGTQTVVLKTSSLSTFKAEYK